jgi:hypothetical protein
MEPGLRGGMLGGMLASPRGTGGPSPMGMLDLSGLFGGGAAPPVAQPKTRINVGKIPANARAEVPPDTTSKAPWGYGPKQKPKAADVARARILRPDYYG